MYIAYIYNKNVTEWKEGRMEELGGWGCGVVRFREYDH